MAVQSRPSDLEAISALVTRVNSSLDLHEVLDQAIAVCAELTRCEGALVYLWDEEQQRLVVQGAIEGYTEWIGRFSLGMGEGLTGWTALTRKVGIITEDPRGDPRYRFVPELNDERFQSVATVPVVGRAEQLLGVLTLHTDAPHEFSESDVSLLRTIAGLVAGAVENAQLHEQALRSVEVFRRLSDLSQRMTAASPRETLQRLAMTTLELFDGELAAVLRLDERRDRLLVEAWAAQDDERLRTGSLPASGTWGRLLGGAARSIALDDAPDLALRPDARSVFAAPLRFEGRTTGLVICQAAGRRSLSAENLELLATIANHAAVALEDDRRRSAAARRLQARDLFDALRAGERRVLDRPHTVVQVDAEPGDPDRLWGSVAAEIASAFPGTLVDARAHELTALVPVASETWQPRLESLLVRAMPPGAGAGISDAGRDDAPLLFRQARIAATIARSDSGPAVRSYSSLGAQRHLWTISREDDPDPLERALARLADHDARRGTQLFRTLEVYLEQHGNGRRAAEVLFIHRNTLRQRLRKIGDLVGRDVREPGGWFELGLAVRLVRFRGGSGSTA